MIEHLKSTLNQSSNIAILTGAGISVASGISAFRTGKNKVWDEETLTYGTYAFFRDEPVQSWSWYLNRFGSIRSKEPNPAHKALAELEKKALDDNKNFHLITQNIDRLHHKSGMNNIIEIHGNIDHIRCAKKHPTCDHGEPFGSLPFFEGIMQHFVNNPTLETLPRCSLCGDFLRPHILWFDEYYDGHSDYQMQSALSCLESCDVMLFVGTSFSVGITDIALRLLLDRNVPFWVINNEPKPPNKPLLKQAHWIEGKAELLLPRLL